MTPIPMLTPKNTSLLHVIDGWHQVFEWTLLFLIGGHILAAVVHVVYYRDGVMRRML
jgi:cytochrome b561